MKKYTTVSELLKAAAGAGGKKGGDKDKRAKSDETKFSGSFTIGDKEVIFRDEYGLRPLVRIPYKGGHHKTYRKTGESEGESQKRRATFSIRSKEYKYEPRPESFHSFKQSKYRRGMELSDGERIYWKVLECKRWTDVEWYIALRMKFNHYSTFEMAQAFDRTGRSVERKFNAMRKKGWEIDPDRLDATHSRWADEEFAIACRMRFEMNLSYKEIGILLGRSKNAVYQHFFNLSR